MGWEGGVSHAAHEAEVQTARRDCIPYLLVSNNPVHIKLPNSELQHDSLPACTAGVTGSKTLTWTAQQALVCLMR